MILNQNNLTNGDKIRSLNSEPGVLLLKFLQNRENLTVDLNYEATYLCQICKITKELSFLSSSRIFFNTPENFNGQERPHQGEIYFNINKFIYPRKINKLKLMITIEN